MPQIHKLNVEEKLLQIREYLVAGYSKQQIQYAMKIGEQTFRKYTDMIYKEDAIMLAEKKERALASDIVVYKNRLEKGLRDLEELMSDPTASVKDRKEIIMAKMQIADQLVKVDSEGTTLLRLKPELQAMIDHAGSMVRNKIEINQINFHNENPRDREKRIIVDNDASRDSEDEQF